MLVAISRKGPESTPAAADVSSKNMLVDRDFSIRVADFGMSRQRRKTMLSAKGESQGTAEWTAPEILRGLPYTESCDVFSFGVVLFELMTQQVPWADLSTIQVSRLQSRQVCLTSLLRALSTKCSAKWSGFCRVVRAGRGAVVCWH